MKSESAQCIRPLNPHKKILLFKTARGAKNREHSGLNSSGSACEVFPERHQGARYREVLCKRPLRLKKSVTLDTVTFLKAEASQEAHKRVYTLRNMAPPG